MPPRTFLIQRANTQLFSRAFCCFRRHHVFCLSQLNSSPTCFEKTAISSLKDSELQTSPPATPGSRGVHVASSHFSKMRARRGKRGCLKQGDFSRKKRRREGGEREYFGRDRQISIGYANWAGERLFTVMAGGRSGGCSQQSMGTGSNIV